MPKRKRFEHVRELLSEEARRLNPEICGQGENAPDIESTPPSKQPNATEQEYYDVFLSRRDDIDHAWFEPMRFYLSNGHSYRPDWVVMRKDWRLECHEVKGGYIYSRDSRILFDTAKQDYPCFLWFWAQKKKGGKWERR